MNMLKKIGLLSVLIVALAFGTIWAQNATTGDSAKTADSTMKAGTMPTAKNPEATQAAKKPAMQNNDVEVDGVVCTGVVDREPVGEAEVFPSDVGKVYFWTKVDGIQDTTMIKHVWYYKGDEIATVQLPIRGISWRTYSYKTIPPEWSGDWVVKVVDANGDVLKAVPFKVGEDKMSTSE